MVEETETRSSCVVCPGYLDTFWERVCYGVSSYGHYVIRSLSLAHLVFCEHHAGINSVLEFIVRGQVQVSGYQ